MGFLMSVLIQCLGAHRIATSFYAAAGAVLALFVLTSPVLACRGLEYHERILLDAIPPAAEGSEVIARVEILDVQIRELRGLRPFHVAHARVLQSVRGIAGEHSIEIWAEPTSCGGGINQAAVGRTGYIAGRFQKITDDLFLFHGVWSNAQIRERHDTVRH